MAQWSIKRRSCDDERLFSSSLHPLLQRIFQLRGITCEDELALGTAQLLHYRQLKGIDAAASLLANAVIEQRRILIVGDFDADGATSTALMLLALRALGAKHVDYLVPNRFDYGYGLTPPLVEQAQQMGTDLIVTVDNGISAHSGVERAKALGIGVLVTDHHLPGDTLPDADAIVNPNQPDCPFPSKHLAGVGVAFYLLLATRQHLNEQAWFTDHKPVNLADYLDLVALGTVADVVKLDQNNRILVHQGLQRIRARRCRPGIEALCEQARREVSTLRSTDLGFVLGPRINAAGRLDDMSLGIQCLTEQTHDAARRLASDLDALNVMRRDIESGMQEEAEALIRSLELQEDALPHGLCLYHPQWHQGVIGILASRVKERYHRPVIAFAEGNNGELKGSGRSIAGLHLRDLLEHLDSQHPGIISKFGGHAMAAGLTIAADKLEAFKHAYLAIVDSWLQPHQLQAVCLSDGAIGAHDLTMEMARLMSHAAPWGQGFEEPVFDGVFHVRQQRIVGQRHLKLVVSPEDEPSREIDVIAFNVDLTQWPNEQAKHVHLAYRLDVNQFRGNSSLQLQAQQITAVPSALA